MCEIYKSYKGFSVDLDKRKEGGSTEIHILLKKDEFRVSVKTCILWQKGFKLYWNNNWLFSISKIHFRVLFSWKLFFSFFNLNVMLIVALHGECGCPRKLKIHYHLKMTSWALDSFVKYFFCNKNNTLTNILLQPVVKGWRATQDLFFWFLFTALYTSATR